MVVSGLVRAVASVGRTAVSRSCRRATFATDVKGRFFTKKHEWVSVKDDVGTVGISSYAQDALGEVVYAQLPEAGTQVAAGDECGALESVKAASEVYTPVSGTVIEKNSKVESTPSLINKSCYEEGWLFRVKLSNPEELQRLMDQAAYDQFLKDSH
ncbi:hypothetical protein ACJJTC_012902 [Scirpophaga incertulas]